MSRRPVGAYLGAGLAGVVLVGLPGCRAGHAPPAPVRVGVVQRLGADRASPGAYGRAGDLVLEADGVGALTFAAGDAAPGHRPLRGALVDVGSDATDRADPLLSWRTGWKGADGAVHLGPMDAVAPIDCDGALGARGVQLSGAVDGVRLRTSACPEAGRFRLRTAADGLPEGGSLVDEVNLGTAHALVQGADATSTTTRSSAFFGAYDDATGWLLESPGMGVTGRAVRIGEQTFQGPFVLEYSAAAPVRTLRIVAGDPFALLARVAGAVRRTRVRIPGGGSVALLDEGGGPLALAVVPAEGRDVILPPGIGDSLGLYDAEGIQAAKAPLLGLAEDTTATEPPRARLAFHVVDGDGRALPVHVMLRGLGGTPDPDLALAASPAARSAAGVPVAYRAGRSIYLVTGDGAVSVAPGRYRVTATHGIRYTLATPEVVLEPGATRTFDAALRDVVADAAWASADFHLHAAPSPDAPVSLEARVASLACEGLDLAVATDHNRVTDYAPAVERLGLGDRIVAVRGDEITSYGKAQWGHFNVYPLPAPTEGPEASALPYFELSPARIFEAAHAGGDASAGTEPRILQVNHPRMAPQLGYFDLTHLDPRSGAADPSFAEDFDAVEAFNGFWLTNPAKVREGAMDLVALARRGVRVAATGNSDSHHLLYEEAGYPRTYVHAGRAPIATLSERVMAAVRRRDTTVSSGPFVEMTVDGAPIGSVVVAKPGRAVRVHVRVTAPAWVPVERVEVWQDDRVAFKAELTVPPVDGVRYEADTDLTFRVDGTVLAWASADAPLPDVLPYANARATGFTGLVYVDANGDGKVDVAARHE